MSQKKILFLLIILVVIVNYVNYFQQDRGKLFQQINLLQNKIEKEKRLNQADVNITGLKLNEFDYFFDQNKTYSQSMGDMQEIINRAAKGLCDIGFIRWSQVPTSQDWYQHLKFNVSVTCKPSDMILFVNRIKKEKELILFKDVNVRKAYKKELVVLNVKLVGFKIKNENK